MRNQIPPALIGQEIGAERDGQTTRTPQQAMEDIFPGCGQFDILLLGSFTLGRHMRILFGHRSGRRLLDFIHRFLYF